MISAAEDAFLAAFEKAILSNGLLIRRRIPLSDGAQIYHIEKPGTDYRYSYEIPLHRLDERVESGLFTGLHVVARFVEDIRRLTNPSR